MPSIHPFQFVSYGVRIEITGNDQEIINQAEAVTRSSLLGNVRVINSDKIQQTIELNRTKSGTLRLIQNGRRIASGRSRKKFFKFFDGIVRITVGEYAVDRVFMHAGVVGWKGKAIIMPADSFMGKTTLVAELVRNGAEYYSDDFAIFDNEGFVRPFPRALAFRTDSEQYKEYKLTPEELGGVYGTKPIPVGVILFTGYSPDARWTPRLLSAGRGVLKMIPHALSLRDRPDFTMRVLNNIANRAIIASSLRGSAEKFAKILLKFVDKRAI